MSVKPVPVRRRCTTCMVWREDRQLDHGVRNSENWTWVCPASGLVLANGDIWKTGCNQWSGR